MKRYIRNVMLFSVPYAGIPFRKHFPFMKSVNYHLNKMTVSGVLDHIYQPYMKSFEKARKLVCSSAEAAGQGDKWKVGLHDTMGFFLLLLLGGLIGVCIVVCENLLFHKLATI